MPKLKLRIETPADIAGIRSLNLAAFDTPAEADIIDSSRATRSDTVSLVALDGPAVVGHILFTPITHESPTPVLGGMGLGPMSVAPSYQKKGIGGALIEMALALLIGRKCPFVVVLGHPTYYPKFGFIPAHTLGIQPQWPSVPKEAFMVLVLDERVAGRMAGTIRYLSEFDMCS